METLNKRDRLRKLLDEANITQLQASKLISEVTSRPCSVRAVRSWLSDPELMSARECPDWALTLLEQHLSAAGNEKKKG